QAAKQPKASSSHAHSLVSLRVHEVRAEKKLSLTRELLQPVNLICALLLGVYTYYFVQSLPHWFHPGWTTDDALQQLFAFHEVQHPGLFQGDLIAEVMKGYLAPLHYWITYSITWLVGDPIMASHWVMLLQLLLASGFIFAGVRAIAGIPAAFVSVAWLLHTRQIVQRLTAGLPRGWAAPIFAAFLFFVLKKNHTGVLLTLLAGCLLHPPATMLAAVTYGLYLLFGFMRPSTRGEFRRPLLILLLLSPLYLGVTYSVVHRPDSVGQMVTYSEAMEMPQLQYPDGRFPFVPHRPASWELRTYGFQAFIDRFYNPGKWVKQNMRPMVGGLVFFLLVVGAIRKRKVIPAPLVFFFISILTVYFLSRELAFLLYVPNRHLQFPMAFFFVFAFPIAVWKAFSVDDTRGGMQNWKAYAALAALCGFIALGSGTGLYGSANFNYSSTKRGNVFHWIAQHTPLDSLIAGDPTFIDGVMLFGERRGFATTETYHPFYAGYMRAIEERLKISFRLHYAKDLRELLTLAQEHGIDYVVFERKRFYPKMLQEEDYFPPLDTLVKELTSRPYQQYAYRELPKEVDLEKAPFMPFKDAQAAIVDVAQLRVFFEREGKEKV
ncbi:MAG: hypothetical protein KDD55_09905, partial [Bdellovibrionales bacterium]|nr:hypothetical protein [Bdellovibrionales bacterium]